MRAGWVLAVLLVLSSAAGCLGSGGEGGTAPTEETAGSNRSTALEAPTWSIGDHWTWSTDQQGAVTYVVTGQEGGDWIVDTTDEGVAFFDARFDVSTLGKVRKTDLAGSQNDTRVQYFDWPLEEGKTWTTTWDGVERTIEVERVGDRSAELVARQDGRVAVEYTYDADARSFRDLVFLDANGTETFAMHLTESGTNFTGTAVRWQLDRVVDRSGTFGAQPVSWGGSFEVPADATDIWLAETVRCPSGVFDFGFGGNGSGYNDQAPCPYENDVAEPVVEDPGQGTWRYGLTASSPDGEGRYDVTLFVRTLVEVPVGQG